MELSIEQLRRYVATLDEPTMAAAAQSLGIKAPALRGSISDLESRLGGLVLFDRSAGKAAEATAAGVRLAGRAREVVEAFAKFERLADSLSRQEANAVRIGAYPVHIERFVARAVADALEAHPNLDIDLSHVHDDRRRGPERPDLVSDLREGQVDIVMAPSGKLELGLDGIKAYEARMVVISSDGSDLVVDHHQVHLRDLVGHPLLVAPEGHFSRSLLMQKAEDAGIHLTYRHQSSNPSALRSMALNGLGVAVVPNDHGVIGSNPAGEYPALTDHHGEEVSTSVWAYWRATDAAEHPLDCVVDSVRRLAKREATTPRTATSPH